MSHSRPPGWIHDWQPEGESPSRPQPGSRISVGIYDESNFHGRRNQSAVGSDPALSAAPRAHTLTQSARLAARAVDKPCRLLVRLALISASACLLLGLLGYLPHHAGGWWIPLVVGAAGLLVTLFFSWRRHQLLKALTASGPRPVVTVSETGQVFSDVSEPSFSDRSDPLTGGREEAYRRVQDAGATYLRVREEYRVRSARFWPRLEATTRALRTAVEPGYDAPWLAHDFRPTIAAFLAVAVSIPLSLGIGILTGFALLLRALS